MKRLTNIGPFARIFFTLSVATGIYFLLIQTLDWHVRLLVAWCGGAVFFIAQVFSMFYLMDAEQVRERCQKQKDEGHAPMLVGGILTAFVSIAAVIYLLDNAKAGKPFYGLHLGFSLLTIFFSWILLQCMFAIYYARLYYQKLARAPDGIGGGMRFTTPDAPDYWEFLYFSLTLAMCYGVTDIAVTSREIRRITLVQTTISFLFYTVIIGLMMNVLGTLF